MKRICKLVFVLLASWLAYLGIEAHRFNRRERRARGFKPKSFFALDSNGRLSEVDVDNFLHMTAVLDPTEVP